MRARKNAPLRVVAASARRWTLCLALFGAAGCADEAERGAGGALEDLDDSADEYPPDPGTITFLEVTDPSGERLARYEVDHGIRVRLRIVTQPGYDPRQNQLVQVGLVSASAEDKTDLRSQCPLGTFGLHDPKAADPPRITSRSTGEVLTPEAPDAGTADGGAAPDAAGITRIGDTIELDEVFVIPPSCLPDGTEGTFHLWASVNAAPLRLGQSDLVKKLQVFSPEPIDTTGLGRNALCAGPDGGPCVVEIAVGPSSGPDLVWEKAALGTSVALLGTDCTVADAEPLVSVDSRLAVYGLPPDQAGIAALAPAGSAPDAGAPWLPLRDDRLSKGVTLTYELCPRDEGSGECASGASYAPLQVEREPASNQPAEHGGTSPTGRLREKLLPGVPIVQNDRLHVLPETDTCSLLTGEWSSRSLMNLRMCARPTFEEHGPSPDPARNNCRVVPVRFMVRPEAGAQKRSAVGENNELSLNFFYGRGEKVTTGAYAQFKMAIEKEPGEDTRSMTMSGEAGAKSKFQLVGVDVELSLLALGYASKHEDGKRKGSWYLKVLSIPWAFSKDSRNEVTKGYRGRQNQPKEKKEDAEDNCLRISYGAPLINISGEICAFASYGVSPGIEITAGDPSEDEAELFDAPPRTLIKIVPSATAQLKAGITAGVWLTILIVRGGVQATLTFLELNLTGLLQIYVGEYATGAWKTLIRPGIYFLAKLLHIQVDAKVQTWSPWDDWNDFWGKTLWSAALYAKCFQWAPPPTFILHPFCKYCKLCVTNGRTADCAALGENVSLDDYYPANPTTDIPFTEQSDRLPSATGPVPALCIPPNLYPSHQVPDLWDPNAGFWDPPRPEQCACGKEDYVERGYAWGKLHSYRYANGLTTNRPFSSYDGYEDAWCKHALPCDPRRPVVFGDRIDSPGRNARTDIPDRRYFVAMAVDESECDTKVGGQAAFEAKDEARFCRSLCPSGELKLIPDYCEQFAASLQNTANR